MDHVAKPLKPKSREVPGLSRRALLEAGAGAGLAVGALGWRNTAEAADPTPAEASTRQVAVSRVRQAAAQAYLAEPPPAHRSNGDEARYTDRRASFAKTLPHNEAGEVDAAAFAAFLSVLSKGDPDGFETIPRDRRAEIELNDPQAAYACDLVGLDGAATA